MRANSTHRAVWVRDYRGKDCVGRPKFTPYYRIWLSGAQYSTYKVLTGAKRYYKTDPPYKPGVDYGRWQAVKSKVLYLLLLMAIEAGGVVVRAPRKAGYRERYEVVNDGSGNGGVWCTASVLAQYSGEKVSSLYVMLPRWCKWGYVERQVMAGSYHTQVYGYRILHKGVSFIDRFASYILPMDRYKAEMVEAQDKLGLGEAG